MAIGDSFLRGMQIAEMVQNKKFRELQMKGMEQTMKQQATTFEQQQEERNKLLEAGSEAMVPVYGTREVPSPIVEQAAPEEGEVMDLPMVRESVQTGTKYDPHAYVQALRKRGKIKEAEEFESLNRQNTIADWEQRRKEHMSNLGAASTAIKMALAGDVQGALTYGNQFTTDPNKAIIGLTPVDQDRVLVKTKDNPAGTIWSSSKLDKAATDAAKVYENDQMMTRLIEELKTRKEIAEINAAAENKNKVTVSPVNQDDKDFAKQFIQSTEHGDLTTESMRAYSTVIAGDAKALMALGGKVGKAIDVGTAMRSAHNWHVANGDMEDLRQGKTMKSLLHNLPGVAAYAFSPKSNTNIDAILGSILNPAATAQQTLKTVAPGKPEAQAPRRIDQAPAGTVRMKKPDGSEVYIKEADVSKATNKGYALSK